MTQNTNTQLFRCIIFRVKIWCQNLQTVWWFRLHVWHGECLGQDAQSATGMVVEGIVLLALRLWEHDLRNCCSSSWCMRSCSGQAWAVQMALLHCVSSIGMTSTAEWGLQVALSWCHGIIRHQLSRALLSQLIAFCCTSCGVKSHVPYDTGNSPTKIITSFLQVQNSGRKIQPEIHVLCDMEIHPNIINPSTPRSPQWSLSLRFPHQEPIRSPLITHTRHMPSPSNSSRF